MAEEMTRRRFVKIGTVAAGAVAVGTGAVFAATRAPEPEQSRAEMGDGMSSVLVVYGTKSGCTSGVAEKIGETLAAHGARVDVRPVADGPDPAGYDAVVVGSGVRMGQWHQPVRDWVSTNAESLKARPTAFYTVCLTLAQDPEKTDEVRAYTDPLIEASGVTPVGLGLFAGWNEPSRFGFLERTILKAMKAPAGDFRDFAAIGAWASAAEKDLGLPA
ncbi:MAG: flavodoxin [Actinobacteria bacterium]|nr:MAG: flavodoxin [Actinomycetota bacterium]